MTMRGDLAKRLRRRRPETDGGFTLLELLVVLVILGFIAAIAAPPALRYLSRAKTDTARLQVQSLASTLDLYRLDVGRYPSQEEGLRALVQRPGTAENWNGPYVKKESTLVDPWGTPYIYKVPGDHGEFDLFSHGADKAPGGSGESQDVTSW
jgi:general secretion pathway protein G